MADFELLAPGGHQKLVDEVEDRLDLKADIDGYYAQLTAGAADNLTGRGDTTTAEFLYRTAGGTADIETGQAVAKSVKGNTLVWNQLCNGVNTTNQVAGVTKTTTSSGGLSAHGTVTTTPDYGLLYIGANTMLRRDGRKYLFMLSKDVGFPIGVSGYNWSAANNRRAFIWSNNDGGIWNGSPVAYVREDDTVDFDDVHASIFDLTAMFGSGNEPSTVAEFEALFPLTYYEYDAGSLLSVNMAGIETTGFNQWDEEWEVGGYSASNGDVWNTTDRIRSKAEHYIPVMPNTTYYSKCSENVYYFFYDAAKGYISSTAAASNDTFVTPANAHYMRFFVYPTYGTTYNHDICINLSWSGRRNGEYEPYWSSQRTIPAGTLRGAGTVYDEQTATERITRVGEVDLGTLNWELIGGEYFIVRNGLSDAPAKQIGTTDVPNAACARYTPSKWADVSSSSSGADDAIGVIGAQLALRDNSYTTAADLKASLDGVYLFYELETPTVTPIDPALNLSYRVDDFGTERVMVPTGEQSAPPVLDIAYGLNVVDFVRRAPSEYISAASFRQYLLARDAHDNTTTTMTWDDTDNRYEFVIADNVTEG